MRWIIAAVMACLTGAAEAACPAVPFVFTTTIRASQINDNFQTLSDCISAAVPIQSVTNTQAVRDLTAGVYPFVQRSYNVVAGDGAAIYSWQSLSTCTDDGQNCIEPTSNPATGRWVLSSQVASNLLLNPNGNAGLTMQPANQTTAAVSYQAQAAGTVASSPTDTNGMALWWLKQNGALIGQGINKSVGLFEADYVDTTTVNHDDTYTAVTGNCNMGTVKTDPGGLVTGTSCVGVVAAARAWASQGGVLPGTPLGGVHGLNVVAGLSNFGTPPTGYNNVAGAEIDIVGCNGCTTQFRAGLYVADFGTGSGAGGEQGTILDAAIAITSVGGSPSWKYGIDFSSTPIQSGNSLSADGTGTVLGSSSTSAQVAAYGIDLDNFVISGASFRCPASACVIDGTGNLTAEAILANNNIALDQVAGTPAVVQFRSGGTSKWELTREATTLDFTIRDIAGGTTDFRITPAGVISLGNSASMTVNATGGVSMPGGGLAVGNAVTGGLKGDGTINVKTGLYINNVIGVTCGPSAPTAAFHVVGGVVLAC